MRVGDLISKLKNLPSREIRDFFVRQKKVMTKSVRCGVLRVVLDDQVKNQKVTAGFSDELNYRLNWYSEFSEYQLESLLDTLNNPGLVELFKEELWLAILQIHEDLGIDNLSIFTIYNKSISYDLDGGGNEGLLEYNRTLDEIFVDAPGEIDGLKLDDFRRVLNQSSTLVELREIGKKYNIDVPRRIKKSELTDIILDELAANGELTKELEERLKKMPVMSLQRFAKDNKIKASIELKKEDIIEYIISHMDLDASNQSVEIKEDVVPQLEPEKPVAPLPEVNDDNPFKDMDVASLFAGEEPKETPAPEAVSEPATEDIFIDPSIFDTKPVQPVKTEPVAKPAPEPEPIIEMPVAEEQQQEETILEFEEVKDEPVQEPQDTYIPQFENFDQVKPEETVYNIDEEMFGEVTESTPVVESSVASSKEIDTIKAQINSFNERLAQLIERQNQLLEQVVDKKPSSSTVDEEPTNIFDEVAKPLVEEVEEDTLDSEEALVQEEALKVEEVVEEQEPERELTGVEALIAEAQKEVEIKPTKRELRRARKAEKLQLKRERQEEMKLASIDRQNEAIRQKIYDKQTKLEGKALKQSLKNKAEKRKFWPTVGRAILKLLKWLVIIIALTLAVVVAFMILKKEGILPENEIITKVYDFINSIWENIKSVYNNCVETVKGWFAA